MSWEYAFLDFIQSALSAPVIDRSMTWITHLGDAGFIWAVAAVCMLLSPKYRKYGVILAAVLISGALLNSFALKPLFGRVRPFVGMPEISLLITPPADASFPSGHTLSSVSAAVVLFAANRRIGIPALILAGLIAFSRMYLYVHFPTDVLAGALLGFAIALIWLRIFRGKRA